MVCLPLSELVANTVLNLQCSKADIAARRFSICVIARVKTGQGFDEWLALFDGFSCGFFDRTRCVGLAGFGSGRFAGAPARTPNTHLCVSLRVFASGAREAKPLPAAAVSRRPVSEGRSRAGKPELHSFVPIRVHSWFKTTPAFPARSRFHHSAVQHSP